MLLALALTLATAGIALALATSEISGTGSSDVGSSAERAAQSPPVPSASGRRSGAGAQAPAQRDCEATESNPGGDNNYIPDAPTVASLGDGFVITGRVRSAQGCRPLAGVPIQIWLATETGGDNRATVRTGQDGSYRIETAPTVPQFGEPNIHAAYDGGRFEPVFSRRVVDLDDSRATVNLTPTRRDG